MWLGVLVRMGFIPMRSTRRHWDSSIGTECPGISNVMSWTKFKAILESLCLYDEEEDGVQENILKKVQTMLDVFNEGSKKSWMPSQWVAIDEGIFMIFFGSING